MGLLAVSADVVPTLSCHPAFPRGFDHIGGVAHVERHRSPLGPADRAGVARRGEGQDGRHHPARRDRAARAAPADAGRLAIRLRDFAARRAPDGGPAAGAGHAGHSVRHVRAPHVARRNADARLRDDGGRRRLRRALGGAARLRTHLRAERPRRQYRRARDDPDRAHDRARSCRSPAARTGTSPRRRFAASSSISRSSSTPARPRHRSCRRCRRRP